MAGLTNLNTANKNLDEILMMMVMMWVRIGIMFDMAGSFVTMFIEGFEFDGDVVNAMFA